MKYYCEACERLVPPAAFRVEDGLLVLKCSRCKVEMRGAVEQDEVPAPSSRSTSSSSIPKSAPKAPSAPVISLGEDDAEADPIENEPTRRMAVPPELLQAIEEEARENRRKKDKEKDRDRERPREKAPVPVLEAEPVTPSEPPEPAKPPEPVKVADFAKSPAPAKTSESGGSNLMVLRLSDVQSSRGAPEPEPAAAPPPVSTQTPMDSPRASGPALRVVRDSGVTATVTDDAFMPPPGFCPKCIGLRKEGSQVCPFCGLDFARYRQEDFRPSPMVSSTWLGVQELWETKSAHDKVLALASERGELPALGRLYRVRLARQPEDVMALRGREEVLRLAAAGSMMLATPPPDKSAKVRAGVMGAFLFLLLLLLVAMGWRAWKSYKGIQ